MELKPLVLYPWTFRAIVCLLFIVSFIVSTARAQRVRVGIKLGPTFSNYTVRYTGPETKPNTKTSVMGGIFVHIPIDEHFYIRPAAEFVSKGSRYTYNSLYYHLGLNYLDIPVNLLRVIPVRSKKLLLGGGPVMSFLLNKEANHIASGTDIGVNVMAGWEWPIGASINFNYTRGFKNINTYRQDSPTLRNYYIGLTAGYWF